MKHVLLVLTLFIAVVANAEPSREGRGNGGHNPDRDDRSAREESNSVRNPSTPLNIVQRDYARYFAQDIKIVWQWGDNRIVKIGTHNSEYLDENNRRKDFTPYSPVYRMTDQSVAALVHTKDGGIKLILSAPQHNSICEGTVPKMGSGETQTFIMDCRGRFPARGLSVTISLSN